MRSGDEGPSLEIGRECTSSRTRACAVVVQELALDVGQPIVDIDEQSYNRPRIDNDQADASDKSRS